MTTVDLPPNTSARVRIPDGRLLISGHNAPYALFDITTGLVQPLSDAGLAIVREDGIEVSESGCCFGPTLREEGPLWFVPWDGERNQLARRVTFRSEVPDGRVLTIVDVGEDWLGSMIVVEPATLDEQVIDDHVLFSWAGADAFETVVYAVEDDDRTGVWATKLAR
jgi:hypothetical protein